MNSENNCFADKISNKKLESIILSGMKEQLNKLTIQQYIMTKHTNLPEEFKSIMDKDFGIISD